MRLLNAVCSFREHVLVIHLRRAFNNDPPAIGFINVVVGGGLILPLLVLLIIDELECRLLVHLAAVVLLEPEHILARVRLLNVGERLLLLNGRHLLRLAAQAAVDLTYSSSSSRGVVVSVESTDVIVLVSRGPLLMPEDVLAPLVVPLRLVVIVRFLQLLNFLVYVVDQHVPLVSVFIIVSSKRNM